MHIVCCIKQVPDTVQVKIDPETNTLIRTGVESICNPYDLVATEAAVKLARKCGGRVTVITMGPPRLKSALRDCLALGADEAILLSDRAFAGADTLATSYTLFCAINKIAEKDPVQLIICGKQAIDGDTAQVGPGIATRLGCNQFTYVSEIMDFNPQKMTITVRREIEGGCEIIEGKLPSLITVELQLGAPHYASFPALVRSLRHEVKVWGANNLGCQMDLLGLKGSPTSVGRIFAPPARKGGTTYDTTVNMDQPLKSFLDALFRKESNILNEIFSSESKG